jgi:hypothetical protein
MCFLPPFPRVAPSSSALGDVLAVGEDWADEHFQLCRCVGIDQRGGRVKETTLPLVAELPRKPHECVWRYSFLVCTLR